MPSLFLRCALLILSAAVLAVAVALRLQHPFNHITLQTSPQQANDNIHCYAAIRTQDEDRPLAKCFTVTTDGRFGQVLLTEDQLPEDSKIITHHDAGYALPGLWDGHGHLLQYGQFLHSVDLFGSESLDAVRERLRRYLEENPATGTKNNWIRGVGWDQAAFDRMPTAKDLENDPKLSGLYIMIDRIDVHCTWVSQPVLDLLPPNLPPIPGGEIIRDPGMGVFCDNAMDMVTDLWPKPSADTMARQVRSAMAKLNEVGLVGMHDAGATPATLKLYNELADSDEDWTVRVYGMLECEKRNEFCPDEAVKISRADDRLTVHSVKLFADGALGSWGSAMIDPYTDHPWTSGSLLINSSSLTKVTKSWASEGYQVNIHAIGDLANRHAIDALEAALKQQCPPSHDDADHHLSSCQSAHHRFRIEHAQIIHPDDQNRILQLAIIPSIQPTHATSDSKYAEQRLGHSRLTSSAYRMKSLLAARPVLGSDFPVEPPNPFQGIYAAVTRKDPKTRLGPGGDPDTGFLAQEALSLDEALWGFTGAPAYGSFWEDKAGVIRKGALADWIVLDEPLDDVDVELLPSLKVRQTWVGGRLVYSRPAEDGDR